MGLLRADDLELAKYAFVYSHRMPTFDHPCLDPELQLKLIETLVLGADIPSVGTVLQIASVDFPFVLGKPLIPGRRRLRPVVVDIRLTQLSRVSERFVQALRA